MFLCHDTLSEIDGRPVIEATECYDERREPSTAVSTSQSAAEERSAMSTT